jgi:S-adenosylmethionine-diacylglycerol 3-amino-3-carboxypropyl transferase
VAETQSGNVIEAAVIQNRGLSKQGLLERSFAFAFKGLVYAQIWEDPVVDLEGLAITPQSHVVTIASGGCNVLSYLTADPASVTAVDLNTAHVALGKLKLAAAQNLPDYEHFYRFFGEADNQANLAAYRQFVIPHLDEVTRRYWEGRDLVGRRRINGFAKGIYKRGLLGGFIGAAHLMAKLYRIDLKALLAAPTLEAQREVFERELAPVFDKKFVRWLCDQPATLFGLGIPPAQYDALAGDERMSLVLRRRLEKLACDFEVSENYFAWQAFGRGYARSTDAPLPPYLMQSHYAEMVTRVGRVSFLHANFAEHLSALPSATRDRYVLLDAQDWMTDEQLTHLWREITRTARPGARVLFRTAAEPTLLPGRVPDALLTRWDYRAEESASLTARDRSSIYGGVHLYILRD